MGDFGCTDGCVTLQGENQNTLVIGHGQASKQNFWDNFKIFTLNSLEQHVKYWVHTNTVIMVEEYIQIKTGKTSSIAIC